MSKEEIINLIKTQNSGYYSKEKTWIKLFSKEYNDILELHFPEEFTFTQKVYHYLNDDLELKLGICPVCGKRCTFSGIRVGYLQYCSIQCVGRSNTVREKSKQTCLKKYGCENPYQSEEIKEKMKQTRLERYDDENYNK